MTVPVAPARFVMQSYYSYKALSWGGISAFTWNTLTRPVLFVTMFALMGRFAGDPEAAEGYIIGMVAVAHPATILGGVLAIFTIERNGYLLPFLFVSSGSRLAMVWSRGMLHMVNGWLSVATSLVFAAVVLKLDLARLDWLTLLAATAAIGVSSTAFALFAGNFAIILRDWADLRTFLEGIVVAFTGAIIPLGLLPGPMALAAQGLPVAAGLAAFRAAFDGASLAAVIGPLAREVAVAAAYAALGTVTFVAIEHRAKRVGSLDWED